MSKKAIILFTVFIDVLGIGIIIPTLPFYVESFGVSAFTVTMLFTVYALFSFISAPFLGALSDKVGRRPVLIISIISTAIGWLVFASAKSVPFLFIGRIIDGLAAGNFSTAQSYLVDLSENEKERTANLGKMGAIFGISFIIGPVLGGLLGSIHPTLPFWFVGTLASINAILAYFKLPETHHKRNTEQKIEYNPFAPITRAIKNTKLIPVYISFFVFGVAVACQQSVFALYLDKVFNYHAFVAGLFMAGVGILISINQGLLLKRFWLKYFKESNLEIYMFLVLGIGFFLTSSSYLTVFIIGMIGLTFGQGILRIVITSHAVKKSENKHGETLGIMSSIMSLSMVIGPIIAGLLFQYKSNASFIFAGVISVIMFIVVFINNKKLEKSI